MLSLLALGFALLALGVGVMYLTGDGPLTQQGTTSDRASSTEPANEPFTVGPTIVLDKEDVKPEPRVKAHRAVGPPVRLVVPRLGIDSQIVGIEAADAVLVPPDNPQVLGWWSDGAAPGAAHGGALITGHTVSVGGGAFDHLETLRRGDRVRVRTTNGVIAYTVTGVDIYRKASLAQDAGKVFSQSVPGRLVLITCEDWNGTTYLSNVVVFGEPV